MPGALARLPVEPRPTPLSLPKRALPIWLASLHTPAPPAPLNEKQEDPILIHETSRILRPANSWRQANSAKINRKLFYRRQRLSPPWWVDRVRRAARHLLDIHA